MDDPESRSELVETVDGVELTKYLEEEGFRFPSIVYEIDSERDETATIRVEDAVPPGVSVEDVGFHPAYGDDYWSVEDGTLVFEYELEPQAQYKTVYALRGTDRQTLDDLLESPDSVEVSAETDAPETAAAMTRSAADSPYDTADQPGTGDLEADPEVESVAAEMREQDAGSSDGQVATEADADEEAPTPGGAHPTESEVLVDRLAAEIEAGRADEESLETLEAAFASASAARGSVDARLEQIQSDISDLRAYTTALESFLDEHGGAQAVIEDFESRQDSFDAELADIESSVSELTDELRAVRDDVADLDEDVEAASTDIREVGERVDALEANLEELDDRLPAYAIDERFADVEAELESVSDFVASLQSAFE